MDRQTFNGWAEAAAAANEPAALALLAQNLAERQLTVRSKRGQRRAPAAPQLREEFRAVMVAAAVDCASKWTPAAGEFDSAIGRAVRSAFDEHARAGGYSLQVTWRGAYSTDKRAFSSQVGAKHKETAGSAALEPEEAQDQGDREARAHMPGASAAASTTASEHMRAERGAAEYTAADQADTAETRGQDFGAEGRRSAPGDADATKGLKSATRGLFSGRPMVSAHELAALDAFESLAVVDRDLHKRITKAGGLVRFIAQGRKKQAAHWTGEYHAMLRRWGGKTREIAKARRLEWGAGAAPGWTGANTVDPAAVLAALAAESAATRGVVSQAATDGPAANPDGSESRTVYRSPDGRLVIRVRGWGWSDVARNVAEWNRSGDRPVNCEALSLLDDMSDLRDEYGNPRRIVTVVETKRPVAWSSARLVIAVSLLDTV